jgi:hypothetical protein
MDEVTEPPEETLEVEDIESTFLGFTKDDLATIVLRAVVSTVVMTVIQVVQKKAGAAINAREASLKAPPAVDPIETTSTEK